MANPFFVQPAQFGQGLQSLAGSVQQFGQQRQEQQRLAEAEDYKQRAKQAMSEAFQSGDPAKVRQAVIQFPEIGETAKQLFGFTNEQTEKVARETYRRALSETDPQRRAAILEGGIETVSQFGGNPRMMTRDLQMLQQNPEAFERSAKAGYAALASEEEYEAMFLGPAGPEIGKYNPRDYTADSFAEFVRTSDPAVLERYASQRSVDIGGVPHVFDPARGGYYPASVSGGGQQRPVTSRDVAESEAEITRGKESAKQDVKAQSPAEQREQRKAIKETRSELMGAEDTLGQIDNILGNEEYIDALTGVRGKVPGIPGTPGFDAEVAFDRLKNSLTLENLGKMSGVLSESDIKILSSEAGGIEPGMSREALIGRMNRIREVLEGKSEDARRRLREMMEGSPQEQQQSQGMSEEDADAFIDSILGQ